MKKQILLIVILLFSITLIACEIAPDYHNYETNNTVSPTTNNVNMSEGLNSIFAHDANENAFYSIQDLETYLFTGSTKNSDYLCVPQFDNFPRVDDQKTNEYIRVGYISLKEVFGVDIDKIESFNSVTFQIVSGGVMFKYYFDKNCITTIYSPKHFENISTTEYYSAYCNYLSKQYTLFNYAKSSSVVDGYVLRKTDKQEIIYTYRDGIPKIAGMVIGDYFVSVTTASSSNVDEALAEYTQFMNSNEFAAISAIFSPVSEVFDDAIKKAEKFEVKQNISNK